MDKPIKQYVQGLIIDTEDAARNFGTKMLIASAQENTTNQKLKHYKHFTQKIFTSNKTNS
jgi:hypothetical protein